MPLFYLGRRAKAKREASHSSSPPRGRGEGAMEAMEVDATGTGTSVSGSSPSKAPRADNTQVASPPPTRAEAGSSHGPDAGTVSDEPMSPTTAPISQSKGGSSARSSPNTRSKANPRNTTMTEPPSSRPSPPPSPPVVNRKGSSPSKASSEKHGKSSPGRHRHGGGEHNTSSSTRQRRASIVNWTSITRNDIRARDLNAVDLLGNGKYGTVLKVEFLPSEGSSSSQPGAVSSSIDSKASEEPSRGRGAASGAPAQKTGDTEVFAAKVIERNAIKSEHDKVLIMRERDTMRLAADNPFTADLVNTLYILMEFCPGKSVKEHITRGHGLKVAECVPFYMTNIFLALKHLHAINIIHRDVKPGNLLIDGRGYIKVCDFGFARVLNPGQRTRSIAGTYAFLAPEQCVDGDYDFMIDLWAAGITMYEMMWGTTPFEGPRNESSDVFRRTTMSNILRKELQFPSSRCPPKEAKQFLHALLKKRAADRLGYQGDFASIMGHPYFGKVDWDAIMHKTVTPPWIPDM